MAAVGKPRPKAPSRAGKPPNPSSRKGRAALKAKMDPQRYSEALAVKILGRLSGSDGTEPASLREICREPGMPGEFAVRYWVQKDIDGFAARYAEARDYAIDHMAAATIAIADDSGLDVVGVNPETGKPIVDGDAIARAKLRVDARKWYVSKLAPKKYGERLQVDADVTIRFADLDDAALNARIMALLALLPKAT